MCHQRPERSFWIAGSPLPVCARCTGLYASASVGAVLALLTARGPRLPASAVRRWLLVAAIPTIATLAVEWFGVVDPGSLVRCLAALPLGAVAGWVVTSVLRERERRHP